MKLSSKNPRFANNSRENAVIAPVPIMMLQKTRCEFSETHELQANKIYINPDARAVNNPPRKPSRVFFPTILI